MPVGDRELVRLWNFAGRFEGATPSFALDLDALRRVLPFIQRGELFRSSRCELAARCSVLDDVAAAAA